MTSWAEKHRPQTLDGIVGNPTAIADMRKWAQGWVRGRPDKKAIILQGDPGVGKTSAALALANEMKWPVTEMNASDSRNAAAIEKTATRGAVLQTFSPTGEFLRTGEGGRKLIVLDEADHVFGREDHGGIAAIVKMIQETKHPVVLIVNDYYALTRRSASLRRLCRTIRFQAVNRAAMKSLLRSVCAREGVEVTDEVLDFIVERSEGDLRSALNDLESIAIGKTSVAGDATRSLGNRDRTRTVFTALEEIFRSGDLRRIRQAVSDLDESPEDLILWVDHNVPHEYVDRWDQARAFESLSRADVYLGRVRRRQDYSLWSYASEMMSQGVAVAREGRPRGGQLEFPLFLMAMSRSRARRTARGSVARKLGRHLHMSANQILNEVLPTVRALFQADEDLRVQLTLELGFDEKDLAYLLDEAEDSHAVKHLLERASRLEATGSPGRPRTGLGAFDEGEDSDG